MVKFPAERFRIMSFRTGFFGLAIAACVAGCGGADGVRRLRVEQPDDAGMMFVCGTTNSLDCTQPSMLLADGHLTNFSTAELVGQRWCDASRFHGSTFSFKGNGANDTNGASIDAVDGSFKIQLTVSAG